MSLSAIYYDIPHLPLEQISLQSTQTQSFFQSEQLLKGLEGKVYATFETGGWPLDGSAALMEDTMPGFLWSAQRSTVAGYFVQPATLEVRMAEPVSATGLTFTFWPAGNQWCSMLRVSWYNRNVLLRQQDFFPDGPRWILQQAEEGFTRVRIEFLRINLPGRYLKLEKLELGQVWQFGEQDLIHAELTNNADPALRRLEADTMQVKIRTPAGVVLMPQMNQPLVLCREGKPLATHYITGSCRHSKQVYTLQARSCLGLLEGKYLGGIYKSVPIKAILDHLLDQLAYRLDPRLLKIRIEGYLPVGTRREALRQVALAAGARVGTDPDGVCSIAPCSQAVESMLLESDIFLGATVSNHSRYSKVEVGVHSYAPGEKVRVLLDEEPVHGEQLFSFDRPYYDYSVTGGWLMDSGDNYVWIQADGPVTLEAKEYVHTVQLHSKSDPKVVGSERENVLQRLDILLANEDNVQTILQQQFAVAQLWQTMELDAVVRNQRAGQKVTAITPWGTHAQGYITRMKSRLTARGQVATVTLTGMEAERQMVCRYSGEINSADEEVLY